MTAVAASLRPAGLTAAARDVATFLELRISVLVASTAAAAAVAAGQRDLTRLLVLAAATLAASGGAGSLDHWLGRDLDARMPRTGSRPVPGGRLSPNVALGLGLSLVLLSGGSEPELGPGATCLLLAGVVTYVGVYTSWLKPRTPFSIVWGGAAGSLAALAGWETAGSVVAPAPLVLAGVLFLWTPCHSWSFALARDRDCRCGGTPTLVTAAGPERAARATAASAAGLVAWSWLLGGFLAWPYLALVVPAGVWFLALTARLAQDPTPERALRVFRSSGLHLLVVLAGLAAAGLT